MGKIRILTTLSKIFANITWAISNIGRVVSTTSKTTIDVITNNKRYDIEIYRNKDEQFEVLKNVSHKKMLDIVKSIEVFPNLSVIISKHQRL